MLYIGAQLANSAIYYNNAERLSLYKQYPQQEAAKINKMYCRWLSHPLELLIFRFLHVDVAIGKRAHIRFESDAGTLFR